MAELSIVGKSAIRIDALDKVTGAAKYTLEEGVGLPGMLYGKVLYSPYAYARILSIDTSRAERLPGVKAILTGKDVPDARSGPCVADRHVLARNMVRFVGDAVVAVAASTIEAAEEALELIKVEYEELPAIFDAEEAMKPDCPVVLHPDLASYPRPIYAYLGRDLPGPNVHTHHKVRRGNVEEGFRKSDLIVENRFSNDRIIHCQPEPFNAVCYPESDGSLTLWTSVHAAFSCTQFTVCQAFALPPNKLRIKWNNLGGNFGAGPRAERFAVLLALKAGQPVKIVYSRRECFVDGFNRLPKVVYIKDGVKRDGTLVAREIRAIVNTGAYTDFAPLTIRNGSFAANQYRTPNFKWDGYGVYTNQPSVGPFRGFGSAELLWGIEQQMDIIAEKLEMDPVDFRKKNILKEGEENLRGEITHSIGAEECLEKVAEWIEWDKPSGAPVGSIRKGKGLALASKYTIIDGAGGAIVKVHMDGSVEVRTGADDVGQGCNTLLAQIAAEEFKIPITKVKIVYGDTATCPWSSGAISSSITIYSGNAVLLACRDAKQQLFERAAPKLGANPEDLETGDGKVYLRESPKKSITIADLFLPRLPGPRGAQVGAAMLIEGGEIIGKASFYGKPSEEDIETGLGKKLSMSYCYTAQAVEVAVDTETGLVQILRFCSANDVGRAINPKSCEGQMEGGAGQGIGSALYEGFVFDDRGNLINSNFTDYRMPSIMQIPSGDNMKSIIVEAPHKDGPYGAKGMGEAAMVPTPPAIANAIYNATGVRLKEIPMTAERVFRALREAKKAQAPEKIPALKSRK